MFKANIILRKIIARGYINKALLAAILFMWNLTTYGQKEIIDHQLWFDVMPHFEINNRLEFYGDGSYRTSTTGDKFRRFVLRPSVRYHWTYELDLLGGLGGFLTFEKNDYNTIELRPYQGVRLNWPKIWRMNFKHRGLIEERLIWNNQGDFNPNLRFRYLIKTKLPLNKPSVHYKTLYIPMGYEIFANVGPEEVERFHNIARAILGLGYVFSEKWIGEFEVMFDRSRSTKTDELILSDRIFRFKLIMNGWIFGE